MRIAYTELSWRYWAVTDLLLIAGLAGAMPAFYAAVALSLVQIVHFRLREGSVTAFPVQVRMVYTAILAIALLPAMHWLFWLPAAGTLALVLFSYCLLARFLSLMPWNRRAPLTWRLVWRTFTSPPVRGNILQGLPALP